MYGEGGYISGYECNFFICRLYIVYIVNIEIVLRFY